MRCWRKHVAQACGPSTAGATPTLDPAAVLGSPTVRAQHASNRLIDVLSSDLVDARLGGNDGAGFSRERFFDPAQRRDHREPAS